MSTTISREDRTVAYEPDDRAELIPTSQYVVTAITALICLGIIMCNLLPIISVIKFPWLHSATNRLVLSLSVADFLMGFVILFYVCVLRYTDDIEMWRWSVVYFYPVLYVCIGVSISSMLLMSLDRFLAVVRPLTYKQRWTRSKVDILSSVFWIYTIVYSFGVTCFYGLQADPVNIREGGLVSMFVPRTVLFASVVQITIVSCAIISLYSAAIYKLYKRSKTAMAGQGGEVDTKSRRATKLMLVLLLSLIITWLPLMLFVSVINMRDKQRPAWTATAHSCFSFLFVLSFLINPLLYPIMSKDYRRAYRKTLRCPEASIEDSSQTRTRIFTTNGAMSEKSV